MMFLHPEFLYLMLPPVLVLFYFILTQKEPTAALFDARVYERLQVREKRLTLRQRNGIYLLIFILLIIAMAQPVTVEARMKVKVPEKTLMVALDISASMRSKDLYPSRLAVAKAKVLRLIETAGGGGIGLLAFGKDVYVVSPPTTDKAVLRQMLAGFEPDRYAEKGTDFKALLAAAGTIMKRQPEKALLLLTDGGDDRDFSAAEALAKEQGLHLFIIGTATPEGVPLSLAGVPVTRNGGPVVTALNPVLESLARATGGGYITAAVGDGDVKALLATLHRRSPDWGKETKEIERYGQLYILPLGFALFLLLIATSSMSRRERVAVPPVLLLGMLLFGNGTLLRADQFAFEVLEDAKYYYETKHYFRAANAFYRYARSNGNDLEALYDSAHALYRAGKYEDAALLWSKIHSKERKLQFRTLHNLGNAEAMQGGQAHLEAAIKAYQRALYLENDPKTRQNLEIVRGRLIRLMRRKQGIETATAPLPVSRNDAGTPSEQAEAKNAQNAAPDTENKEKGNAKASEALGKAAPKPMSDFEAAMWMKTLQQDRQTHLYKITPVSAGGGDSVAPW